MLPYRCYKLAERLLLIRETSRVEFPPRPLQMTPKAMMFRNRWKFAITFLGLVIAVTSPVWCEPPQTSPVAADATNEQIFLQNTRQLTFEGLRSGEGYFSSDGTRMVFQSEREPGNPFYQIYLMDLETGDVSRISPGTGKTTCAWIHPSGDRVLFASTHTDPDAVQKQEDELELRASGRSRRYAWDYDPHYQLFSKDLRTGQLTQLSDVMGYDAEASYSPDGTKIVFASNRAAYGRELTPREATLFEIDQASLVDLYIMDADGGNVRRLTEHLGYDGGPFFSADGKRICWRRFSEDGKQAEIYAMNIDGSDQRQLTNLGAMSWAPYFHPSGDYLIFTTNIHGYDNFELYLVRADGSGDPVRVTETAGADLLPVFLPDGKQLSWTSTRTANKRSQIFLADWDDAAARQMLGLAFASSEEAWARQAAIAASEINTPEFRPSDSGRHVDFLTRPELGGRMTGTAGERQATAYVAAYLESLGYQPAGPDGSWFHEFEFPAGSQRTDKNRLQWGEQRYELDKEWTPLAFSGSGDFDPAELVFAGYGLQIPGGDDGEDYDSYVHLDVAGKWVIAFRDLPQDITAQQRQRMSRFSAPNRKAQVARDLGARGLILVAGPTSKVRRRLMRFDEDASQAGVSIAVVSVADSLAQQWLAKAGEDLAEIQKSLDGGQLAMGFVLKSEGQPLMLSARIDILRKKGVGRNVLGRLPAGPQPTQDVVILGAHVDHLGTGRSSNSLAGEDESDLIHYGADDNASGVAAMLEVAQYTSAQVRGGRLQPQRDLIVAAWSGEELGLFGSQAFVREFDQNFPHTQMGAYLNLDMVGRLREKLIIQGVGSSPQWESEINRRNIPVGLALELDKSSSRLPTDAASFVSQGIPILAFFTGAHEDYHTPRDTAEKLNYEGLAKVAHLTALLTRGLLLADQNPTFDPGDGQSEQETPRVRMTASLGTIPDYASGDVKGVKLSGVRPKTPAEQAGIRGGDVIVELAGRKIENIYDYTYAIEALKVGEPVTIALQREDKRLELKIVPVSRD